MHRKLPGPPAWKAISGLRQVLRDPLVYFVQLARDHGDVAMARIGPRRVCLLSHPEHAREVLVTQQKNFIKSLSLRRTSVVLGQGLLTSDGEPWRTQRRLMQPAFHRERIAGYADTMVAFAGRHGDGWRDGATVDVHEEMMHLTLAIAGMTLFGALVEDEAEEIGRALDTAMALFRRVTLPMYEILNRLPLPSSRRLAEARARLDATIYRMIAARRAEAARTGDYGDDLLGMLLSARDEEGGGAGAGMTDEQVRDEAITLFLAGHETTANALTWTWVLLSRHPEVEAALHAEVDAVLGDRVATAADLPRLPYTRAVLAESMRLYPPAWILGREALDDFEVGGYTVPKGTMVFTSQWIVHRDARWWPEPEAFRPERWTPAMEAALPKLAYFPFGGGPRKCIGEAFAWMEGVLVLATLARRWRVRVAPGEIGMQPVITLRPVGEVRARLERRPPVAST